MTRRPSRASLILLLLLGVPIAAEADPVDGDLDLHRAVDAYLAVLADEKDRPQETQVPATPLPVTARLIRAGVN